MSNSRKKEKPTEITTSFNVIKYYPIAEKLSISRPMYLDEQGQKKPGKTVTLDIAALLESDQDVMEAACEVFSDIVDCINNRLGMIANEWWLDE